MQHGTGHGVGSFLNVHEGLHGFSSDEPLTRGHVLTNEPGYCKLYLYSLPVALLTWNQTNPMNSVSG